MWMILVVILAKFAILLAELGEKKLWKKNIAPNLWFKLLYGLPALSPA
tara:strand:- start:131 stop:274 length:144 start_codon:yes stop_codon:yes gene_type:complete